MTKSGRYGVTITDGGIVPVARKSEGQQPNIILSMVAVNDTKYLHIRIYGDT